MIFTTFLENVSRPEMEEEFVKLTEVVLKFELKKHLNLKSSYCNDSCFFFGAIPAFRCNLFIRRKGEKKGFSLQSGLKYQ
jgi:hypothetical protein